MRARARRKTVTYKKSLVTYLDILGFRSIVQNRSAGTISRTLRLVKEAVRPESDEAKIYEMEVQSFSDLTVVSIPLSSKTNVKYRVGILFFQVLGLIQAQMSLIREGILLRGAITIGDIVRSYGLLYGPALVEAYDLERNVAKYPRIVIDRKVFRELKINPLLRHQHHDYDYERESLDELVETDPEGTTFLDYLGGAQSEFDDPETGYPRFLLRHRDLIRNGLRNPHADEGLASKYAWLRDYHNATVQEKLGRLNGSRFLV